MTQYKRLLTPFTVILLLSLTASAQVQLTPSHQVRHALAFVNSPDAPGALDENQVRQCYSLLAQRLKVPENDLPHVVVIHASAALAHAADVHGNCVRANTATNSRYYELWVVGKPNHAQLAQSLYTLFERHYNLQLSAEEKQSVGAFVMRMMNSTVSAHGGH